MDEFGRITIDMGGGVIMSKQVEGILFLIWAISVVATSGSLFFSEVMGYVPCELCWYQRILMYPLIFIYGISYISKEWRYCYRGILLRDNGLCTALFHYLAQWLKNEATCGITPCSAEYINWLGFITIPFLSASAFAMILVFHLFILFKGKKDSKSIDGEVFV